MLFAVLETTHNIRKGVHRMSKGYISILKTEYDSLSTLHTHATVIPNSLFSIGGMFCLNRLEIGG